MSNDILGSLMGGSLGTVTQFMLVMLRSGGTLAIIALICAVAAVVVAHIFVLPENKARDPNPIIATLHNILSFKILTLDKILKALFILLAAFSVLFGVLSLFAGMPFVFFLVFLIVIPVSLRIKYELMMLLYRLVQHTKEINKKLGGAAEPEAPEAPSVPAAPRMIFCTQCGTQFDANQGVCPNCGTRL